MYMMFITLILKIGVFDYSLGASHSLFVYGINYRIYSASIENFSFSKGNIYTLEYASSSEALS